MQRSKSSDQRLFVEENAILIERPTRETGVCPAREIACKFHGQTTYFAAALAQFSGASQGVPAESVSKRKLMTVPRFHRLGAANAGRQFARWLKNFNEAAAGDGLIGRIVCEGPLQSGPYRWETTLPVFISPHVDAALKSPNTLRSSLSLPKHSVPQLRDFLSKMNDATALFYKGQFKEAAKGFSAVRNQTDGIEKFRYRVHAGMWEFRCLLRYGNEEKAKQVLRGIERFIERVSPSDPILEARAAFNRAWRDLSEIDVQRQLHSFELASERLLEATPDDARWGYLLGIQGRLALRKFKHFHSNLREDALIAAREAIACFAHSAYLLSRAEDHWGMQEACWNVADGLFRISHIVKSNEWGYPLELSYSEIESWIALSDSTSKMFNTGEDSIRNDVLRARIKLICGSNPIEAIKLLEGALVKKKDFANDKEKGRVWQLLIDAHLLNGDSHEAYISYKRALAFWESHEAGKRELRKIYQLSEECFAVKWRSSNPGHLE